MDDFQNVILNTAPVWLIVVFYMLMTIYKDIIKEYYQRKINQKLEVEKKNIEVKRYNEEMNRWEKLFHFVENDIKDVVSYNQAQFIYTSIFNDNARELYFKLVEILDKNEIKNPLRQKNITTHLKSYLELQKNRIARALDPFNCNNLKLSNYVMSISEVHTLDFIEEIKPILFDEVLQYIRKKDDLWLMISSHYNEHINEALDWLKEPVIKAKN